MSELDELRNEVDAADDAILAALKRRFDVTDRIRALKAREGLPRVDAEREREILARVAAAVPPAKRDTVCGVWERILSGTRGENRVVRRIDFIPQLVQLAPFPHAPFQPTSSATLRPP